MTTPLDPGLLPTQHAAQHVSGVLRYARAVSMMDTALPVEEQ